MAAIDRFQCILSVMLEMLSSLSDVFVTVSTHRQDKVYCNMLEM